MHPFTGSQQVADGAEDGRCTGLTSPTSDCPFNFWRTSGDPEPDWGTVMRELNALRKVTNPFYGDFVKRAGAPEYNADPPRSRPGGWASAPPPAAAACLSSVLAFACLTLSFSEALCPPPPSPAAQFCSNDPGASSEPCRLEPGSAGFSALSFGLGGFVFGRRGAHTACASPHLPTRRAPHPTCPHAVSLAGLPRDDGGG